MLYCISQARSFSLFSSLVPGQLLALVIAWWGVTKINTWFPSVCKLVKIECSFGDLVCYAFSVIHVQSVGLENGEAGRS